MDRPLIEYILNDPENIIITTEAVLTTTQMFEILEKHKTGGDVDTYVCCKIAVRYDVSQEVLRFLSTNSSSLVKKSVAANQKTGSDILDHMILEDLRSNTDYTILKDLLQNKNASSETLDKVVDVCIRSCGIIDQYTSSRIDECSPKINTLFFRIVADVVNHENASTESIDKSYKFLKNRFNGFSWGEARGMNLEGIFASNTNASSNMLREMAFSTEATDILNCIILNANTPSDLIDDILSGMMASKASNECDTITTANYNMAYYTGSFITMGDLVILSSIIKNANTRPDTVEVISTLDTDLNSLRKEFESRTDLTEQTKINLSIYGVLES